MESPLLIENKLKRVIWDWCRSHEGGPRTLNEICPVYRHYVRASCTASIVVFSAVSVLDKSIDVNN